jgi:chromosome partitioning protein
MATVVGFISEKGGVGKTTACYEIAWDLHWTHNKRVMVVDTDYQRGGITCRFLPALIENFREGRVPGTHLYHKFQHLYSETDFSPDVDLLETAEEVALLPADPRLGQVSIDKMPASNNIRENNRRLWTHLSLIRAVLEPHLENFDYILLDSHPDVSDLLRSVIYAADYCVSPVKLDLQSTIGVPSAIEAINSVNADMEMISRALDPVPPYTPTEFAGAIGMMAREWGGMLKLTERAEYRRLERTGAVFRNYVTEGDGVRQAARDRITVQDVAGANAARQAAQFRAITVEFMERCPI